MSAPKEKPIIKKRGMSLEDLKKYNPEISVANKIIAALKELGDAAETMEDFRRRAGISYAQCAQQMEAFEDHIVPVREFGRQRFLWAGTKEFAREARIIVTRKSK